MTKSVQTINSITTDQLLDLIHASIRDLPEWDPAFGFFGLTEAQTAFSQVASPQMVLSILDSLDGYQQGAKAEADGGDEARAEVRTLKAQLQIAEAALKSAISTAQWQALTNKEMNAAREEIRKLTKDFEQLEAFHAFQQSSAQTWKRCFQKAEKERDDAIVRANYWKQRAKSAEGHLFSSDFRAAAKVLHKHTVFSTTPWSELTDAQQIQIEIAAGMTIAAVNERRDARNPGNDAGVDHG
jgi:hypothetical protein